MKQLASKEVGIAGFQEAREKKDQEVEMDEWIYISAAGDSAGCYGCSIAISKTWVCKKEGRGSFTLDFTMWNVS